MIKASLSFFFCLFLICFSAGFTSSQKDQSKEVVCFVYHRVADSRYPSTNISLSDFEAHLKYLTRNHFQILTMAQAIAYLQSDDLPKKTAVITIDDGYKSFFKNGFPLLKKYGVVATLYINTETVGGSDYMGWKELAELQKAGIEIGNHTVSHQYFMNLPGKDRYKTFADEIRESQQVIRKHLGVQPTTFSYPYGEFDSEMKDIVRREGFTSAAAQNSGVLSTESDLLAIPRFPMSEAYAALPKFIEKVSAHALPVSALSGDVVLSKERLSPELRFNLGTVKLDMKQFQCFIQGNKCRYTIEKSVQGESVVTINPAKALSQRRRTLCTITVRGVDGGWYWYSHLWINPAMK
jgi:peptidoglycan/xylan/chitin deacetylase (PgdA/CDA1 family)